MLGTIRRKIRFWREYYQTGEYELSLLPRYVDRKRWSVDVGCNVGSYAYHLGRLSAGVHAFDPNPACIALVESLGLPRLRSHAVGLSDQSGSAELRLPDQGFGGGDPARGSLESHIIPEEHVGAVIPTQIRTLDSYDLNEIGFVKIDVEGHEEAVLRGALDTVARNRPILLLEIEDRHNPEGLARVREIMKGLDYKGHFYFQQRYADLDSFDPALHQRVDERLEGVVHRRRELDYVNNFFFTPA